MPSRYSSSPPLRLLLWTAAILSLVPSPARSNPAGERVVAGSASFDRAGSNLTVRQGSDRAIIDWQSFSIGAGSQTTFLQPSASSATLNRVVGSDLSAIHGTLQANGKIYLINPNGVLVGPTGVINTAGFVASTLDVSNAEFLAGGDMTFRGKGSTAAVMNLGRISADGGDLFLIAKQVENHGELRARGGTVGLAAGTEVLVKASGEQRLFIQAASEPGTVENRGLMEGAAAELKAAGGNEYALAINNSGTVRATGVSKSGGRVFLSAGGKSRIVNSGTIRASGSGGGGGQVRVEAAQIEVGSTSMIDASADASSAGPAGADGGLVLVGGGLRGQDASIGNAERLVIDDGAQIRADGAGAGAGGEVVLWADGRTKFAGEVSARGGAGGGAGGFVEVSGKEVLNFRGQVDTGGGTLLLDPANITVQAGAGDQDNTWGVGQINTLLGMNDVILSADVNITWNGDATLSYTNTVPRTLTLEAGGIVFNSGASIAPGALAGPLNVTLTADNLSIGGTTSINSGAGTTTIRPRSAGTQINLGGADGAGVLGLTAAELNQITAGKLVIGSDGSTVFPGVAAGTVTVSAAMQHADDTDIVVATARNIAFGSGASWTTTDGDLTFLANQQAAPSTGSFPGILLDGATITTSGMGNLHLTGRGGSSASSSGIRLNNGSIIQSTAAANGGTIELDGTGQAAGNNHGVYFNSNSLVTSVSGAIQVVGTTSGHDSVGVLFANNGRIRSTGTGAGAATIDIVGVGSTEGIDILSAAGAVGTVDGEVTLTGVASGGTDIRLRSGGGIQSTGSGGVTLTGNRMEIANFAAGTATVRLQTRTAGTQINLGGADAVGTLGLTNGELNAITAGTLIIGRNDIATGTISVSGSIAPTGASNLSLITAANIGNTANASLTVANNASFTGASIALGDQTGDFMSFGSLTFNSPSAVAIEENNATVLTGTSAAASALIVTPLSLELASGATVQASGSGDSLVLSAGTNFINHSGANALQASNGRWLVYSDAPAGNVFGSLLSGNQALYDRTFAANPPASISQTGNRYLFANQTTLTVTAALTDSKIYGNTYVFPAPVADTHYAVTGFVDASTFGGVFTQDTAANIGLSGAPVLSSVGAAATATVAGSPYTVEIAAGTLASSAGYTFGTFVSGGVLTVTPKALTVTANNQSKIYGNAFTFAGTEFSVAGLINAGTEFSVAGLINADTVTGAALASAGAAARANVAWSPYAISVAGATGSGLENYDIQYVGGQMRVDPRRIVVTALGGRSLAGRTPRNPGLRADNLASFDSTSVLRGLKNSLSVNRQSAVGTYKTRVKGRLVNPNYVVVRKSPGIWKVVGRPSALRAPKGPVGIDTPGPVAGFTAVEAPVSSPEVSQEEADTGPGNTQPQTEASF